MPGPQNAALLPDTIGEAPTQKQPSFPGPPPQTLPCIGSKGLFHSHSLQVSSNTETLKWLQIFLKRKLPFIVMVPKRRQLLPLIPPPLPPIKGKQN